ncbi:MAG: hypothetical protein H7Z14_07105 [Anaerolineae bacterium]|nr:hypothetical protein [Phycisphaerae bacterium]
MSDVRPTPLEYAPSTHIPWHARVLPLREMMWIGLVLGLIAIVIAAREQIARRYAIMRLEQQIGSFSLPVATVFYSDMTRSLYPAQTRTPMDIYLRTAPVPFVWPAPSDAVFGHWVRSLGGSQRLLIVTVAGWSNSSCMFAADRVGCVINFVLMPPSRLGGLRESDAAIFQLITDMPIQRRGIKLHSLQVDPIDASHISFAFETTSAAGTIDVRLQDDGSLAFTEHPKDVVCGWAVRRDAPVSSFSEQKKVPVEYLSADDSRRSRRARDQRLILAQRRRVHGRRSRGGAWHAKHCLGARTIPSNGPLQRRSPEESQTRRAVGGADAAPDVG